MNEIFALLVYAVTTSTGLSDSDRMKTVIEWKYKDTPTIDVASAGQTVAPICPKGGLCNE